MRIKRFLASDMRTALRMVRDEQGPDAVILSNRTMPDGIEVVSATDYDEALMSQALRAAAPGIETTMASARSAVQTRASAPANTVAMAAPAERHSNAPVAAPPEAAPLEAVVTPAASTTTVAAPVIEREAPRESLMSRARAMFRISGAPTTGTGTQNRSSTLVDSTPVNSLTVNNASAESTNTARTNYTIEVRNDDEQSFIGNPELASLASQASAIEVRAAEAPAAFLPDVTFESLITCLPTATAIVETPTTKPASSANAWATEATLDASACDADYLIAVSSSGVMAMPDLTTERPAARLLHAVASPRVKVNNSAMTAMRAELAMMRSMMENQMSQLSLERMRGSPARSAVLDALLGYGCDDAFALSIASQIDPRLAGDDLQAAVAAQFASALPVISREPIEDGGVIALVGPTGAGKTTTAAKLAARFAARHSARDVALVSIDRERIGAREQLHIHGRRLGVTVCEANSNDQLADVLHRLADYPLVLVDTTGYGVRDRGLLRQARWLRSASRLRSLLVLPANANPHDLGETIRRNRPATTQGVVLTKLDDTGRAGAVLSVLAKQGLPLAYTSAGQQVENDLQVADAAALAPTLSTAALEKSTRAAVNTEATEDRHAFA